MDKSRGIFDRIYRMDTAVLGDVAASAKSAAKAMADRQRERVNHPPSLKLWRAGGWTQIKEWLDQC
jgi:hypothetical protein